MGRHASVTAEPIPSGNGGDSLPEVFVAMANKAVAKFRHEFELLPAPLDHSVSPKIMESTFVNGLKEEIRAKLRLWDVLSLDKITGLAQKIEKKNNPLKKQLMGPLSTKAHFSIRSPINPCHSLSTQTSSCPRQEDEQIPTAIQEVFRR